MKRKELISRISQVTELWSSQEFVDIQKSKLALLLEPSIRVDSDYFDWLEMCKYEPSDERFIEFLTYFKKSGEQKVLEIAVLENKISQSELALPVCKYFLMTLSEGALEKRMSLERSFEILINASKNENDFYEDSLLEITERINYALHGISIEHNQSLRKEVTPKKRKNAYSEVRKAASILKIKLDILCLNSPSALYEVDILERCLERTIDRLDKAELNETPLLVEKPRGKTAKRRFMIKELQAFFRKKYGKPLNEACLLITLQFYDCSNLTIEEISKRSY